MTYGAKLTRRALVRGSAASAGALLLGACSREGPSAPPATGHANVPGARLYYETAGSGPLLLMIHAGTGEASDWDRIAPALAQHYRVVTYDRRGNSRSTVDDPRADAPPAVQADDAANLLRQLGGGPTHVFGSSAGGLIALDLAARHPDLLRTVVAHEPPVFEALPDPAPFRALADDVYATYLRDGVEPALVKFFGGQGGGPGEPDTEPGVSLTPDPIVQARSAGNNEFFLAHEMKSFMGYQPDFAALRAGPARPVIGVGPAGTDLARIADAITQRLGTKPVQFPGAHAGYRTHPKAFAARLLELLRNGR